MPKENLLNSARKIAEDFAKKDRRAFQSVKMLLRKEAGEEMKRKERDSILEFADIWYSESTWKNLQNIKIHD